MITYENDEISDQRYSLRSIMASTLFNKYTEKEEGYTTLAKGTQKNLWILAYEDELGMLAQ